MAAARALCGRRRTAELAGVERSIDVRGMNFLSRLAAWRVEGRALSLAAVPAD